MSFFSACILFFYRSWLSSFCLTFSVVMSCHEKLANYLTEKSGSALIHEIWCRIIGVPYYESSQINCNQHQVLVLLTAIGNVLCHVPGGVMLGVIHRMLDTLSGIARHWTWIPLCALHDVYEYTYMNHGLWTKPVSDSIIESKTWGFAQLSRGHVNLDFLISGSSKTLFPVTPFSSTDGFSFPATSTQFSMLLTHFPVFRAPIGLFLWGTKFKVASRK